MNDGVDRKDMLYIIHSARSENKLLDAVTRLCPDARPQFDCRAVSAFVCVSARVCLRACAGVFVFAGGIYLRKKNK